MNVRIGVIALGCVMAFASPSVAQGVSGGVKLGVNFATLNIEGDDEELEFKVKSGIVAGAFVGIAVNDMFSIQPEFLFSQKGSNLEGGGEEGSVKLDYFEIPVLAVIKLGTATTRPFVVIGPSFGLKIDAKLEVNGEEEEGFDEEIKGSDVGLVLGAGVEFARFILEGRYNMGLSDIAEEGDEVKTRAFSILVGVRF